MPQLTNVKRVEIWQNFMSEPLGDISVTKQELRLAVDEIDTWLDDNFTSFNQSIPQPARAALTRKQKVLLMVMVLQKRFGVEV